MTDIKEARGLEVVAWLVDEDGSAEQQPLCRLSDATAVIDQLRAENEVLTLRVMAGERQELDALKSAPVVMPERKYEDGEYACGWNDSMREVSRLNRSKT